MAFNFKFYFGNIQHIFTFFQDWMELFDVI